ncbi:MAG: ABC transporter permease [Anaerolineae bacterium]|nr:ABC transporter permease [Anaerolineae bacterium]
MNVQFTLAIRYLSGRKLRTVLTTLAIVFGVLVIFGMNTMLPAFMRAFQSNVLAAAGQVDATITLKTSDAFDANVAGNVAAVTGVRAVSGFLNRTINVPPGYFDGDSATAGTVTALSLVGINVAQATILHAYPIKEGRFLESGDSAAAVISKSLAEAIGVRLGETFTLPAAGGETVLTVVGILPARALPGNEEVLVTLPQAQTMLAMPGKINTIEANYDTLDKTRRAEIERAILGTLGDTYQVGSLASNSELLANMYIAQAIFSLLGVLALLMGGFIIFNTFRTVVAERRRDIGMLRALGANRTTITGLILSEGLVQGLVGTATGLVSGYLLGAGLISLLSPIMMQFLNAKLGSPVISLSLVIGSIVMGVGVTILAGLLPAMSASRVTPLDALRPPVGTISFKRLAGLGFWSGAAMIALAVVALITRNVGLIGLGGVLFILGLILMAPALVNPIANLFAALAAAIFARGGTAQLAEGNLSRQPTRAAITASTTLIGMAILVMAASMMSSIQIGFGRVMRKSLGSDYLLIPPSVSVWGTNVGASPKLAEELRAVNGVAAVSTLRFAPTQINGVAVSLLGIDPASYSQVSGLTFSAGTEATAYAALGEGRNIIFNPVLAASAGVKAGDEITLIAPTGQQAYRVVAIAGDFINAKIATGYISHANIEADFNRSEDVFLQINLAPQADTQATESALKGVLKAYPQFRLIAGQEYMEEALRLFNAAFAGMIVLVIFLAVPSLIAMVNTLAIGVIERTREIGMLRAVGATRRQVRTIIVTEAIILAAIGTAFGVLSGLYLGYMGVETIRAAGFPMEYVFPAAGVLLAVVAGILFGVLAAVIPARQAARLVIVQALRYE